MNVSASKKETSARRLVAGAVDAHKSFRECFEEAKKFALLAGFLLNKAKALYDHGDWSVALTGLLHGSDMSERSARAYMQFATEALEWVAEEQPQLTSDGAKERAAEAMVMQSPKGFVSLCRELKLMRKFGEYDSVAYALSKQGRENRERQLELFSYEECTNHLQSLMKAKNVESLKPATLAKLRDELIAAQRRVEELLADHGAVDLPESKEKIQQRLEYLEADKRADEKTVVLLKEGLSKPRRP